MKKMLKNEATKKQNSVKTKQHTKENDDINKMAAKIKWRKNKMCVKNKMAVEDQIVKKQKWP